MASTYTTSLRIELQANGENSNTWGTKANTGFSLFEQAIAGYVSIATTGSTVSLTASNAASDQSRPAFLEFVGVLTSAIAVVAPSVSKGYVIRNNTSGNFSITMKCNGDTGIVIPQGQTVPVICNGSSVMAATTGAIGAFAIPTALSVGTTFNVTGATSLASTLTVAGATSIAAFTAGATSVGALTAAAVSASSLVLTTPLSITSGGTGYTTANLVVQALSSVIATFGTSTATTPSDNSIPQITEGSEAISLVITPKKAGNLIVVDAKVPASNSNGSTMTIALHQDAIANALTANQESPFTAEAPLTMQIFFVTSCSNTSPITYRVRVGSNTGNTSFNGVTSGRILGGASLIAMKIQEISP